MFDFEPCVFIIGVLSTRSIDFATSVPALKGNCYIKILASSTDWLTNLSWQFNTISWWSDNAGRHLNGEGKEYFYVALG